MNIKSHDPGSALGVLGGLIGLTVIVAGISRQQGMGGLSVGATMFAAALCLVAAIEFLRLRSSRSSRE